jgi:hypothetical protein
MFYVENYVGCTLFVAIGGNVKQASTVFCFDIRVRINTNTGSVLHLQTHRHS